MAHPQAYPSFGNRANLWRPTGIIDPDRAAPIREHMPTHFSDREHLNRIGGYTVEFHRSAMKAKKAREEAAAREAKIAAIKSAKAAERKAIAELRAYRQFKRQMERNNVVADYLAKTTEPFMDAAPAPILERITIADIAKETAAQFNVSLDDIRGKSRMERVVLPRQVAMYLAYCGNGKSQHDHRSCPAIGRYFGGRDHTTVLHSANKIASLRDTDERLEVCISMICNRLGMSVDRKS